MSNQNNTKKESVSNSRVLRVVCVELTVSQKDVLKFIPSAYLAEIEPLLEQVDAVEVRLKIADKIK